MKNDTNTPDHGEPWQKSHEMVFDRDGDYVGEFQPPIRSSLEDAERAVSCVNACAGQDPVDMRQTLDRLDEWHALTNADLRLRLGEMTAQEIRTVRAVLNAIKGD